MAAAPLKKKPSFSDHQNSEEKPSTNRKKKSGDEIDEIFQSKKRAEDVGQQKSKGIGSKPKKKLKKISRDDNDEGENKKKKKKGAAVVDEIPGVGSKRRRTTDGLVIYSAEDLGVGNPDAGGTPLCPFDCSCCF